MQCGVSGLLWSLQAEAYHGKDDILLLQHIFSPQNHLTVTQCCLCKGGCMLVRRVEVSH